MCWLLNEFDPNDEQVGTAEIRQSLSGCDVEPRQTCARLAQLGRLAVEQRAEILDDRSEVVAAMHGSGKLLIVALALRSGSSPRRRKAGS